MTTLFKTPYNGEQFQKTYEVNDTPSMTIPDQSMPLGEMLRRFASGLPVGGSRVELYESTDDVLQGINPKTLDLTEWASLKEQNSKIIEQGLAHQKKETDKQKFQAQLKIYKEENDNEPPITA